MEKYKKMEYMNNNFQTISLYLVLIKFNKINLNMSNK